MNYPHRFLARIVIEAATPLAVGNGEKDILTDAVVATDVNGLPYIPGTAIAGVVRHMIGETESTKFFGVQDKNKPKNSHGSNIIFTEAKILNSKGDVVDGLDIDAIEKDSLLKHYHSLPIRQHVRINERGVADSDNAGKFDEQVVFAGTRFCFEIEMMAKSEIEQNNFGLVLSKLRDASFRIGGGTRCGFGKIAVVSIQEKRINLGTPDDKELYLSKSSNLEESSEWQSWSTYNEEDGSDNDNNNWIEYTLTLTPDDFFLFGSGFGDNEVDMTPVKESKVIWKDGKGSIVENQVLIPATSVKGALSHRTAYHWNRLNGRFAGTTGDKEPKVGNENPAVRALFGYTHDSEQQRGNVLFSDLLLDKPVEDKILNHVSIDRFTGGAIDGALFSEKTTYLGRPFEMKIMVDESAGKDDEAITKAFEEAMKDICRGLLPLGGGVNRGNGVFTGTLKRGNELIYPKK